MSERFSISPWKCYCGHLARLKFRGVRCIICRTECLIKQPNDTLREYEMAEWLASDYQRIGTKNAIHLTLHTRRLVQIVKDLNT